MPVPAQIVERAVGGRDHFDVEALEQRARPELGPSPGSRRCGRRRRRRCSASAARSRPNTRLEGVVEPEPRRRAAEQMIVARRSAARSCAPSVSIGAAVARAARRGRRAATPWLSRACGRRSGRGRSSSCAGSGNGGFSAYQRGSVWPCGLMIGRSRMDANRARAIARVAGSAGNRRSGSSISYSKSAKPRATGALAAPAFSSRRARRSAMSSRHGAAMICTPIGSSYSPIHTGTATTGSPMNEIGCV